MRAYIDLATDTLVSGPGTNDLLRNAQFKRGASAQIEVQFLRAGIVVELDDAATGIFEIKASGNYDGTPLVRAGTWTKVGTGIDTYYVFEPDFNTVPLNAALAADGIEGNDQVSINAMMEIEWTELTRKHKTQTVIAVVNHDVIKDSTDPTPMPTPIGGTAPVNAVAGVEQFLEMSLLGITVSTETLHFDITIDGGTEQLVFPVAVIAGDTPSTIGTKIIDEVSLHPTLGYTWFLGQVSHILQLSRVTPAANDPSMLMELRRGATVLQSSMIVVDGVAEVTATASPPYLRVAGGFLYVEEAGVWYEAAVSVV